MNPTIRIALLHRLGKFGGGALAALALFCGSAWAQDYPTRAIRIVVPWGPGGALDVVTRIVAPRLSERLGQSVVVENKIGANGIVGTDSVAKAAPDGYTLIIGNTDTHTLNPHVFPKIPYDAMNDFIPIAPLARVPLLFATRPGLQAATLPEAVAMAKSQPGKFTYGSWGTGSIPHLGILAFIDKTGIDLLHVPYKDGVSAFGALMGSQIDFMLFPIGVAVPQKKAGKIKVLGIFDPNRSQTMEDVPTLTEQGYPIELRTTFGLMAPAKTPRSVVQRLASEVSSVLKLPEVKGLFLAQGTEIVLMSPEEYFRFLRAESTYWGDVVRKFKVTVQ